MTAIATYGTKLDDDVEIATSDPAGRRKIEDGMRADELRAGLGDRGVVRFAGVGAPSGVTP
jgi:hypothetical protein